MVEVQYLGHSFFKVIDGSSSILIDPVFESSKTNLKKKAKFKSKISDFKKVSLILITNETPEHFDASAVEEIAKKNNSIVVGHESILQKLDLPRNQKANILSNSELNLKGVKIKSKTAHFPRSFYPLAYLIEINGKKIYHAGVTTLLDNFNQIKADVALLPINSKTMDVIDAVRATKLMKPDFVIPMQYDIFEEKKVDTPDFKRRIEKSVLKTKPVLLNAGQTFKL
ncbi:MAG: MBL fold metallo-hydrolase [Candidatus Iainarchaeum sp.]|jgi:L-ascorbate metabolism protein UlaG (beta-lactamase superfamily)|nr:MAG: metal-dependent hydrolase [archaeon ADurb.Bin336]